VKLSEGPRRSEFTKTPWLRVGIGFGAILGFSVAARWALRSRRTSVPHPVGKALGSQGGTAGSSSST